MSATDDARAFAIGQRRARVILDQEAAAARERSAALALRGPDVGSRLSEGAGFTNFAHTFTLRDGTNRVVFGIGDSWFDYLANDVFNVLDRAGFDTSCVARQGESLQKIAYQSRQLDKLSRLIEESASAERPGAILLSAGGNDLVDSGGLKSLLNQAESGLTPLNESAVAGLIEVRIRTALVTVLSQITAFCQHSLKASVPILLHGYDFPVADGRGALFGIGPWLGPDFDACGYHVDAMDQRKSIMKTLIDRLNVMQLDVAGLADFAHVTHVDLRATLSTQPADYDQFWANELHPTRHGFQLVADRLAVAVEAVTL